MDTILPIRQFVNDSSLMSFPTVIEEKKQDFLQSIQRAFQEEFASIASMEQKVVMDVTRILNMDELNSPTTTKPSTVMPVTTIEHSKEAMKVSPKTEVNLLNRYDDIVQAMADKYDVSFDLIKRVIQTESTFNPNAISKSGAMGLMQLMPKTADWLGVKDAMDPKQNIEGGVKYLSKMLTKYNGDVKLALAAYNAGPGNVDKYGGVPPFDETQRYVKKILG